MINMGLNEVLDLKECLEDIIEDMDPDHLSGMLSLCATTVKSNTEAGQVRVEYIFVPAFSILNRFINTEHACCAQHNRVDDKVSQPGFSMQWREGNRREGGQDT